MKFLKSYIAMIIIVMVIGITNTFAQSSNSTPNAVSKAFTAKYPKAEIKKWSETNGSFTAKAKDGRQKFFATFDQNGNWLSTASKINGSGNLPSDNRLSLGDSKE